MSSSPFTSGAPVLARPMVRAYQRTMKYTSAKTTTIRRIFANLPPPGTSRSRCARATSTDRASKHYPMAAGETISPHDCGIRRQAVRGERSGSFCWSRRMSRRTQRNNDRSCIGQNVCAFCRHLPTGSKLWTTFTQIPGLPGGRHIVHTFHTRTRSTALRREGTCMKWSG